MKARSLKVIGVMILIAIIACVVTYADKQEKQPLPDEIKVTISELYPEATIEEVKLEREGLEVYEVELEQADLEFELTIAPDGTLVEVEDEIAIDELPDAVKSAIAQAAAGAQIEEVKREVTYYIVTLKKLEIPETTYEAEFIENGKEVEIEFAADGTVLEQEIGDKDEDNHDCDDDDEDDDDCDDDEDDDDEDEEQLSIDEVPAAVKTTILSQVQGGTVKEIEREDENGRIIYEAELLIDGQEIGIKVSADGTLLGKEVDDDDEDDDDAEDD